MGCIRTLEAQKEPVAEFDERLRGAKYATSIFRVDYVTAGAGKRLTMVFRAGTGL